MNVTLLLMGFGIGLLIGFTGVGGAALVTPLLILFFGVRPVIAVGSDLMYGAITKIVGAWIYWRQGMVDFRTVKCLAYGSIPGNILGIAIIFQLQRHGLNADEYVRRAIGFMLILVAAVLLTHYFGGHRNKWLQTPTKAIRSLRRSRWQGLAITLWGAFVGFAVGFTSVGSGSLVLPFLMVLYPLAPAKAVGTDIFHAVILLSVSAFAHLNIGTVDWSLVFTLLIGSVPGVALGSCLAPHLPARHLRVGLAIVVMFSGTKLLF